MAGPVASPTVSSGIAELLKLDWNRVVAQVGVERAPEHPFVMNVGTLDTPTYKALKVTGLGALPTKPIGSRFAKQNFSIMGQKEREPSPYGSVVEHSFEAQRDEQTGHMTRLVAEQARAGRNREEVSAFLPYNTAFTAATLGFASEPICGNHVGDDGVTRSNAGTAGLSILGLQQMMFHFHGLQNEKGRTMVMIPELVLLHYENVFIAREIFGSPARPYTADNEINSLVAERLSWMVGHFLTSTSAWFGLVGKEFHDGKILHRDRRIFNTFNDPFSMNVVSSIYQRHTDGFFDEWRGIYGSPG